MRSRFSSVGSLPGLGKRELFDLKLNMKGNKKTEV